MGLWGMKREESKQVGALFALDAIMLSKQCMKICYMRSIELLTSGYSSICSIRDFVIEFQKKMGHAVFCALSVLVGY